MAERETPILVVGAGPTGLTMACELARHGAPVRIVDKLPGIVPFCRANGIHSRTLEVFQDMGVADQVVALSQPVDAFNLYANGERIMRLPFDAVDSPFPGTVTLEQWHTEEILEDLLGRLSVKVERETELVGIEDRLDGVCATVVRADGSKEQIETPWLIGCDGAHSTVRHMNRQHFPGEADPRHYVVADVIARCDYARGEVHSFLCDAGMLEVIPLPHGRTLLVADIEIHHEGKADAPSLADFEAIAAERLPTEAQLSDPRWLAHFHINYRVSRHYRHGRTLLAGDAVHVHSPVGGHGMNLGIQDAYNLAWKLALVLRGRAPQSLLDSYERERRTVAEDYVAMIKTETEKLVDFPNFSEAEREKRYRHTVVPAADRSSIRRRHEHLDLDYRKSPVCKQHIRNHGDRGSMAAGPHAGAEALDAGPLRLGDRTSTLFELLRGPQHTMLLFAGPNADARSRAPLVELADDLAENYGDVLRTYVVEAPGANAATAPKSTSVVQDLDGALHRRYGVERDCLYLIRPDGYVGYRSEPVSLPPLRDYLERVFTVAPPGHSS